jgi:tripartite-type tricarboxylate transporter receptor subunit TctC
MSKTSLHAALLACGLSLAGAVSAQTYPTKPIRIIVPTAPGGVNDVVTRLMSPGFSAGLGQPVVIENRAGADTVIGSAAAAKSAPDGYTLLSVFDNFPLNQLLSKNVPYDAMKDFVPVSLEIRGPQMLVVNAQSGIRDVAQLVKTLKSKADGGNYATAGAGSSSHLSVELFKLIAGMSPVAVHLKGGAPAMTELVAGRVDMMIVALGGNAFTQIKAGKITPLGVSTLKRNAVFPEVPAIAEQFPGFEAGLWLGMVAPAGTPDPVIRRVNADLVKALNAADVKPKLEAQFYEVVGSTPDEFGKWMAAEYAKWGRVIREQKISLDQ